MNSQMEQKYAFFDVDNTVLDIKSMFSFLDFYISESRTITEDEKDRKAEAFYRDLNLTGNEQNNRKALNRKYYEFFSGRSRDETIMIAEKWFSRIRKKMDGTLYIKPVLERMQSLKETGVEVVFVSGSCHEILSPIMKDLRVSECIATVLEVVNGKFTGNISGKQIIGDGKSESIKEYAATKNIDLGRCYAFGDHVSDLDMLAIVGMPTVIEGDRELEKIASERSWEILRKSNSD